MKSFYNKLANPVILVIIVLIFLCYDAMVERPGIKAVFKGGLPQLLALQLAFSPEVFRDIANDVGADEIKIHLYADTLYPFLFALLFSSLIAWLTNKKEQYPPRRVMVFFYMPWIACLLDQVENNLQLVMLSRKSYPFLMVFLASSAALVKWVLLLVVVLYIIYKGVKRFVFKK